MFNCPALKPSIHIEKLSEDSFFTFDDLGVRQLLEGEVYAQLLPLLKSNTKTTDELLTQLEGKISDELFYYALLRLEKQGVITEAHDLLPLPLQAYCDHLQVESAVAAAALKKVKVEIVSLSQSCDTRFLQSALQDYQMTVCDKGDLTLVIVDNYRDRRLQKINEKALRDNKPWVLVKPVGCEIWVGPLFNPTSTGCYECLLHRLKNNFLEEELLEEKRNFESPIHINAATLHTSYSMAFNLLANEVFKWIVNKETAQFENQLVVFHPQSCDLTKHHFTKRPQCSVCAAVSDDKIVLSPLVLSSRKKVFTDDGGHRAYLPEATYEKYAMHISPITGVVDGVHKTMSDKYAALQIYLANHTMAAKMDYGGAYRRGFRSGSAGKGKTDIQAKTSCICEAIERHSGIYQGDEHQKLSSYSDLGNQAIHPYEQLQFSDYQYDNREKLNKDASSFHIIPKRFDDDEVHSWTPVWSLTGECYKWIPTAICYYSYPWRVNETQFVTCDSNGCAAGNNIEEAILQGFFELIERDAVALWWYSRVQMPQVDLTTFSDPYIEQLVTYYNSLGRELWVIDITMDQGIPNFAAISYDKEMGKEILFGFGTHFDVNIALLRALTEMNQSTVLLEHVSSDKGNLSSKDKAVEEWFRNARIDEQFYLLPHPNRSIKTSNDYASYQSDDIKEDVIQCKSIVESKGLEMLVLDQTRVDIGLSVAKVFVPGLRHFWNRYAPGRLYDVPYKEGYVKKPLGEQELNPIPVFF